MTTTISLRSRLFAVGLTAALVAAGCGSGSDDEPEAEPPESTTTTNAPSTTTTTTTTTEAPPPPADPPEVTGPVEGGNGPVLPQPALPAPPGYVEEEFFVGGDATSYRTIGEEDADGFWTAEAVDTAPYRTRVIVRRPEADAFSGVVVIEWLNVTAVEASPDWAYLNEEVARSGHAYVAVSAQALGVVGGQALLSVEIDEEAAAEFGTEGETPDTGGLVNADPERYGSLAHPGDAYAFDIFTQVGQAVMAESDLMLAGLEPSALIALGESQSAGFLTTYLNAVHPLTGVYDGFLVHSRGAGGAPIEGGFGQADEDDDGSSFVSDGVGIRTDLDSPVMMLQTETDLTLLGFANARQPDTDTVRTWEVAGTAHADAHILRAVTGGPRNPAVGSLLGCDSPINAGPHHEAVQAALRHLVGWAQGGPPPPASDPLQISSDPLAIVRDDLGIALGGVRNPLVDVPIAVYQGDPPGDSTLDESFSICALFGQTLPIDQAMLIDLHGDADGYIEAFGAATDRSVADGFLLPEDAAQLLEEAEANRALFD